MAPARTESVASDDSTRRTNSDSKALICQRPINRAAAERTEASADVRSGPKAGRMSCAGLSPRSWPSVSNLLRARAWAPAS